MKNFWKWFLIVLGILFLVGIVFLVVLWALHGSSLAAWHTYPRYYSGGMGMFGGMFLGMGLLMLFRWLLPLGVLVLAGFGVAYLVKRDRKAIPAPAAAAQPVCAHCGKPLNADWSVCPYCGEKVVPQTPPAPQA
jgi:uncharacterized membrane protein